ncbi:MAG TPA: ankyrin repeat domain-containing protein [Burkholderiales bacterium]|nr:ankyrin repeat domain-containing protein [Burkholderiales bacterium]
MQRGGAPVAALALGFFLLCLLPACAPLPAGKRAADSTGLYNAIVTDDADTVRAAIRSGAASVNQRIPAPGYLEGTPLITLAAKYASLNVLRYLIAAGADVNARTPVAETALMLACYFMEESFLGGASYERHEQAARLLAAAGADLEGAPHGYTALSYAAYRGRDRTVRFLLERGARVNGQVADGVAYIPTPLMMAAMMGHRSTVLLLLAAGADPRIRVHGGHTARELAEKRRNGQIAQLLACAENLPPGRAAACECAAARPLLAQAACR